ncbi:hypothetical protein GS597_10325 [Synechococcales cyanobacterium C]|uniref:Uncharacterized protein n=1 Tax=Petrachloros mirabilis ULC683 TaxID=2781853 RepID=A0A8K1ZZN4_9CYAN|nr:hypothetical protein [Petrachloros mirabilis]NCJ06896.1 hypothetical protein [Petrachloros mirabilis ULC683]
MQDKHKVTLYLPPELHRQLKIKAAVDAEPMSALAERALSFYLDHSEVVESVEFTAQGSAHQVYACPECLTNVVVRSGEMVALKEQPALLIGDELNVQAPEPLVPVNV